MATAVFWKLGVGFIAILAISIFFWVPPALAINNPIIPRELLFGNPEKSSLRISPDGSCLAYIAPASGVLNIFIRTVGKEDDTLITSDKKRGIRQYFWQYDGKHILYIQDKEGDENWHLFQTDLQTKMTRDLTPFDGIQARIIAYEAAIPDVMLVGLNVRDRSFHDVYRLNLKNGALDLDTENTDGAQSYSADNSLQVRFSTFIASDGGTELKIREKPGSPWKLFQKWGPDEMFGGVAGFTRDNRSIWLISSVDANSARLLQVDLETGSSTVIAQDPQYDVGGLQIHPVEKKLEAVGFLRDRSEWQLIDSSLQPDFDILKKVRDADFDVMNRDLADRTWIVAYEDDDSPVTYYAYDRISKKASFIFSNQSKLEKFALSPKKPISFKARDGLEIHGYLTLPVGMEPKNLTTVLLVHGGPWGRDSWGFTPEVQWLANRGYAVLEVNFRGSTGYGKAFLNAGDREWAGKMHNDLLDAKAWAVKEGFADPGKVAIYGGSYGGYATLVGLTFTPEEFACGIDMFGPSNLITLIKSIPPYWAPMKALFDKRMGKLETEEDFLKARSPLFKADKITKPLMIAQGANDPRVKQAESDQIVEALRKKNIPVEYLVIPDEGHGFARPENRLKFYAAAEEFLSKILGGRKEPPSESEKWDSFKQ